MLETLLIVILLPVAIVSGLVLAFVSWLLWKYILAVLLWACAGITLLYAWFSDVDVMIWFIGFFIAGVVMWVWARHEDTPKPKVLSDK